jgi:hypothetical protein
MSCSQNFPEPVVYRYLHLYVQFAEQQRFCGSAHGKCRAGKTFSLEAFDLSKHRLPVVSAELKLVSGNNGNDFSETLITVASEDRQKK